MELGLTQAFVAYKVNVSESLVKEWERGRRFVQDAMKPVLARKIDCGKFYMALKSLVTGGVSSPELDGPMVDKHRNVAVDKAVEEMLEAVEAIKNQKTLLYAPPELATKETRETIRETILHQSVEALTGIDNMIMWICSDYGISPAELWDMHHRELAEKGYTKEKTPACAGPRVSVNR
jgi:transcriptional regulator with XRE-family HTH domain